MGPRHLVFLQEAVVGSTQRERELNRSVARSHAAKVSSRARKEKPKTRVTFQHHGRRSPKRSLDRSARDDSPTLSPLSPGLLSILREGNSDPFHTLAVPVTARVNQILAFFKDGYLPMIYRVHVGSEDASAPISAYEQQEYQDGILALREKCSARALLFTYVTVMVKLSPNRELSTEELVLKGQSLKALREQLIKDTSYSPIVLDSVLLLFQGALIAGNFREASIHANILRRLLERKFEEEGAAGIDVTFLLRVLYQNGQLSAMRFSRSIVDVENWVPKILADHFHFAHEYLNQHRPRFAMKLDSSVSVEPLRSLFQDSTMAFWLFTMEAGAQPDPQLWGLVQLWIHVHSMTLTSRIVDFILMTQSSHQVNFNPNTDPPLPNPRENLFWQTQRILALALLINTEIARSGPPVVQQNLYTKRSDLLARLQMALKLAMRVVKLLAAEPDGHELVKREHSKAHLWAFCVGAWEERRDTAKESKKDRSWCTQHFVLQARQMGLKCWADVKGVLEKFYYEDVIMPGIEEWVTDLLKAREKRWW